MHQFSATFPANFAVFHAYKLGAFSVFFAGKLAENCMAILYIFKLFRDDFLWDCVQGWEGRDPGQVPV